MLECVVRTQFIHEPKRVEIPPSQISRVTGFVGWDSETLFIGVPQPVGLSLIVGWQTIG